MNRIRDYIDDTPRYRLMEQARRRRMLPETAGHSESPLVKTDTEYTPSLRRIDWAEVGLWILGAGMVFVAGMLIGMRGSM